jgi:hypothetical protein
MAIIFFWQSYYAENQEICRRDLPYNFKKAKSTFVPGFYICQTNRSAAFTHYSPNNGASRCSGSDVRYGVEKVGVQVEAKSRQTGGSRQPGGHCGIATNTSSNHRVYPAIHPAIK